MRSYVPICDVFTLLVQELLLAWLLIAVIVSFQTAGHSEVIHEEWMLINMLKDAELALVKGQLLAILKVEMWVKTRLLLLFLL